MNNSLINQDKINLHNSFIAFWNTKYFDSPKTSDMEG